MAKTSKIRGKKYLVIVESPTKEKTISRFLDSTYNVKSSFGHVRDLPEDSLGIDEKKDFNPTYVILPRVEKMLKDFNTSARNSQFIYLATDPDREGEAIAWHLTQILDAEKSKFKRITFHEITKQAVVSSLKTPRDIDFNLVHAQQARRIIDRLVGYKLSPLLWEKVSSGLSAGRVQSVAVRLIAERTKEIENFVQEDYYTIFANFTKEQKNFQAKLVRWQDVQVEETKVLKLFAEDYKYRNTIFKKFEDTVPVATFLRNSKLKVSNIESRTLKQKPKPPFITSTLQQDAYNRLGFSSERTMRIAQSLYEGVDLKGEMVGLITYMRTDSFNVSSEIQRETREFILNTYGKSYLPQNPPVYQTKVKRAQEAHEAIHPTSVFRKPEDIKQYVTAEQYKLYDLIWKRFVASQMEDAVFDMLIVEIEDEHKKCLLRTTGRTMKFEGYLKVYGEEVSEESEENNQSILPPLVQGEILNLVDIETKSHKTSPPSNYNEASIIKTLEKHGIGRPSTYAVIIKTIQDRGYVRKNPKDKKLVITDLGKLVTEKLKDFFPDIMDIDYTASIENGLDDIADGSANWIDIVKNFYAPFSDNLAKAQTGMKVSKPEPVKTQEKCPICRSQMVLRESRFGKYLSCSRFPKCRGKIPLDKDGKKKEVFAPITTEKICSKCNKRKMLLRKGPGGYFLACSGFPRCRKTEKISQEEVEKIINFNK